MATTTKLLEKPRQVSRWFRFDWQYVLATSRLPAFKPVVVVLAAMPILSNIAQVVPIGTTGFWLIWGASVASLLALAVTRLRCPAFVREYERFDDYGKVGHSHRWIGWLFYHNQADYSDLDYVIRETVDKGVTIRADAVLDEREFAACPIMTAVPPSAIGVSIVKPVNAKRDLYIGIWIDGLRHVLALQEDDPKLGEKTKELFWLMFTNLVSSRPCARTLVWSLYGVTLTLSGTALIMNLAKPLEGLFAEIGRLLFGWGQ